MMRPLYIEDYNLICSLGDSRAQVWDRLVSGTRAGFVQKMFGEMQRYVATLDELPALLPVKNLFFDNRVNRISNKVLEPLRSSVEALAAKYGKDRIAVIVGSCDNGSEASLAALEQFRATGSFPGGYSLEMQRADFAARFIADLFGLAGPVMCHSTACASSASAFVSARNMIYAGVCDAAVVGGVDIASLPVVLGFSSLEAVSPEPANPFSANRAGITLGDGAAFFVVSREPLAKASLRLCGTGESADADNMTAPLADGSGAGQAMLASLRDAALSPADIDYVNLHGTGTRLNDAMESVAMDTVFPQGVPASSTKGLTGHTLGAAAALELAFCCLALSPENAERALPVHLWDGKYDAALPHLNLVPHGFCARRLRTCMSNSYGFGGCNVSLIVDKVTE